MVQGLGSTTATSRQSPCLGNLPSDWEEGRQTDEQAGPTRPTTKRARKRGRSQPEGSGGFSGWKEPRCGSEPPRGEAVSPDRLVGGRTTLRPSLGLRLWSPTRSQRRHSHRRETEGETCARHSLSVTWARRSDFRRQRPCSLQKKRKRKQNGYAFWIFRVRHG